MRDLAIKAASWLQTKQRAEEGQTTIEYALVIGLVVTALVVVLVTAGTAWIGDVTTKVAAKLA
jgi:Flp pilus assembly pilin Flp